MCLSTEWMVLVYVVVGGFIGGFFSLMANWLRQKHELEKFQLECGNQRKMLIYEKVKIEQYEAYKHVINQLRTIRVQILTIRTILGASIKMEDAIKSNRKLPDNEFIKNFWSLPPDIKSLLFEKYKDVPKA